MAGRFVSALLCVRFELSELSDNWQNEVLGFQGYCNTVRKTQDLTIKGRKTGVFFRTIRIVHIIQKPRKPHKTVLFSAFGLLESLKKAVKNGLNTSLNGYFAKSLNCTV